ncbi:carboxymuconolactone decarboxylase family protein [Paenirhodobacter populi]|uniref:Carboxymuconolactone decarboxylase family protein n=1 Tax=Paenirhodobacter populi TaxID=2306993 RepID=A0A443KNT2_9RHOB|nr:carboxymuconolactone decarboxylase family protein [Sinirhodobacter populi]RWR07065.1 carboxymuconolactone decarboxylase family protein [Sinirhodobacter populi]RWR29104.1 carboxymuconolactone decarboxylase family protein [Sinirhodobacter populi]RWR34521.1 carboxymuconolactone decarboxylase family protein [Sinirhodobacter populi]
MTPRLDFIKASPEVMKAVLALDATSRQLSIPLALRELVKMRVSQINGCAYCLDMHAPEAREAGISQQKLDVLAAWRESPAFDARERAALGWAEALTRLEATGAPQRDYDALAAAFSPAEQVDLTLVINVINALNRFAVGFRSQHPARAEANAH